MNKRICTKCGKGKPEDITNFGVDKRRPIGLCSQCRKCLRIKNREYMRKRIRTAEQKAQDCRNHAKWHLTDKYKSWRLMRDFGITLEQFNQAFEKQGGICAVCGRPETATINGKIFWLSVDHDHNTGKVRGLLCHKCNIALGHLEENPVIIQSLLTYITKGTEYVKALSS